MSTQDTQPGNNSAKLQARIAPANADSQLQPSLRYRARATLNELIYQIRRLGFNLLPYVFSHPDFKDHNKLWEERDPQENKNTSPPDEELIHLYCLWVVEIYPPSNTQNLISSLRALGWTDDDSTFGGGVIKWIQRNRALSLAGGWLNLGFIMRPGQSRLGRPLVNTASIPEQFTHVTGGVYNLNSGITCIVMNFVLNDAASLCLDRSLRQDRKTYSVPTKNGYRILEPRFQKIEDLRSIRNDLRKAGAEWFRKYLPGAFSRGILEGEFPTCEFIGSRIVEPFPGPASNSKRSDEYLQMLSLEYDFGAWDSKNVAGLKFAQPDFDDDRLRHHSILAIRESDLAKLDLSAWGSEKPSAYIAYLDRIMSPTMSRWGLLALLSGYERTLSKVRDSTIFSASLRKNPLRVLHNLKELVAASIDISTIARDLRDLADKKWLFNYGIGNFTPARPEFYKEKDTTLEDVLRTTVSDRSARLYESERIVRDLLVQHGTMLGTAENIRLQGIVTFLTWVLVVLTILLAVLTAAMAPEAVERLLEWMGLKNRI